MVSNPYRFGSRLHIIFSFMSDGKYHVLENITQAAYFLGAGRRSLYRRRTASALRTIRRRPELFLTLNDGMYRMQMKTVAHQSPIGT